MILMNDFNAEPQELRDSILKAAERVINSGWYVLGKELESFESQWAKLCGATNAVGVGNGMDAIEIALRVLSIGKGDEVITTPMTAFATVLAIYRAGATPVLADIDKETALLSMDAVSRCVTRKTKAVLLVHLYGQIKQMKLWREFCNHQNIYLIEDCAQSHMANQNGKMSGTYGDIGAFSFYPTKNLGALGDAGMLITDNDEYAQKACILRNYGQKERYYHSELGLNSRLDELQAAILSVRIKWLNEFTEKRKTIAQTYLKLISNDLVSTMAAPEEASAHVYHLFVVTSDRRSRLQKYLQESGIQTLIHYPVPIHMQQAYKNITSNNHDLFESEKHSEHCLSLPCHPCMGKAEVDKVVDVVNSFKG